MSHSNPKGVDLFGEKMWNDLKQWENRKSHLSAKMAEKRISIHCRRGIVNHIMLGLKTGNFMEALFQGNSWYYVHCAADDYNKVNLEGYYLLFRNDIPKESWGTTEKVKIWRQNGGICPLYDLGRSDVERAISLEKVTWP